MTSPPRPVEATPAGTASLRKDVPPFERILVANRGEIAVRIFRACRELGIATVAVFSDADADGGHVRAADEAIRLGPAPPTDSYLRSDLIVEAARRTGAEAIHPGYGFLAERASFAAAVEEAGLVFIGPNADAIARLGDKLAARRLAAGVGVPVVPGTLEPAAIDRPDAIDGILAEAERIGFPLLVKTSAGGGGRGMRRVESGANLVEALAAGSAEAASAFGDGSVYLERVIEPARHIEVQLLGDAAGTIVAIGERDCSLQRRHQKLVEEAPSPVVNDELRARMSDAAVALAREAGYVNAGTVEFLVDFQGNFYFIEMNTRIQVEHPVTEMITGLDLVAWQLKIAAGERLTVTQEQVELRGHSIEVRINAEDPDDGFKPRPGTIERLFVPGGKHVRWDSHIYAGYKIPSTYDSMIGKLIVWGEDREEAIERMRRALGELIIEGVPTSASIHRKIMSNVHFRRGTKYSTSFIEEYF